MLFPKFWLLILINSFQNSKALLCHYSGFCEGVTIGLEPSSSYNDCLASCQANSYCTWFTHFGTMKECVLYNDCPVMDSACENCYSGNVDCPPEEPICDDPGLCDGHFAGIAIVESETECTILCKDTERCEWFSYLNDTNECLLTEDCLYIDNTDPNWIHGEKDCQLKIGNFVQ
jgi:hypothetical protein